MIEYDLFYKVIREEGDIHYPFTDVHHFKAKDDKDALEKAKKFTQSVEKKENRKVEIFAIESLKIRTKSIRYKEHRRIRLS